MRIDNNVFKISVSFGYSKERTVEWLLQFSNNAAHKDTVIVPRAEGPDFIGVGIHKSGTTWLAEMLSQHPGILLTKKEINFFVRYFYKGYRWYHNWFADKNGRMAGECTPNYIISPRPDSTHREFYPHWNPRRSLYFWRRQPSARDELKSRYPGIVVYAIFRNPVDRAWSAYWFWRSRKERLGKRVVSFDKMWADDGRWIRTQGLYADHLTYWREAFPDFGVFFFEDIKDDPLGLVRSVCRLLGVDDTFTPRNYARNERKGQYEPMSPELREKLVDFYRDQIFRFSEMTGRDLSHWLKVS